MTKDINKFSFGHHHIFIAVKRMSDGGMVATMLHLNAIHLKVTVRIFRVPIFSLYNDKIIGSLSSHFVQIKGFVVKFNRSVQV